LNLEFFIASHIVSGNKANFSKPIVRIAVISIALGIAVMIISVAIVTGFQKEIRDKVIGFGAHIQISNFDSNNSLESTPVSKIQTFYPALDKQPGIRHIQVYATKAGIIRTSDEIQGVVLKGVGSDYDWSFFKNKIISGSALNISDTGKTNEVLISKILAGQLRLGVDSSLIMYFINEGQSGPSVRKFKIHGIYETGLEEFDKLFVIGDIKHIQRLNQWDSTQVGGFEVLINDFDDLDRIAADVYASIGYDLDSKSIKQLYPQIFDWLGFQDVNVAIILIMMAFVAVVNMISALLILIIEKTTMIGILKALGLRNWSVRKIFLYNAAWLVVRGLFWGNVIALGLCFLQLYTGVLKLDAASYYVSQVPINLSLVNIVLINSGTIVVCLIILIIPSYIITRITPLKAIRFD